MAFDSRRPVFLDRPDRRSHGVIFLAVDDEEDRCQRHQEVRHEDITERRLVEPRRQRIFASTRFPKEQSRGADGIRITGRKGDTIYIASWHLETGCIPNRMVEEAIPQDPDHARLSPETIAICTSAGVNV